MLQCLCSSADGMKDVGLIRLHVLRDVSLGWVSLLPTKYYKTTGAVSSTNTLLQEILSSSHWGKVISSV